MGLGEATPIILHFSIYLPNTEMTLDLEVNEVEVKGLTSLASVTETPVDMLRNRLRKLKTIEIR
jgi:hypothetical protein